MEGYDEWMEREKVREDTRKDREEFVSTGQFTVNVVNT